MVLEILANAWELDLDDYHRSTENIFRTNTTSLQNARRVNRAGCKNDFSISRDSHAYRILAPYRPKLDTGSVPLSAAISGPVKDNFSNLVANEQVVI
jgi:hypothetical protein